MTNYLSSFKTNNTITASKEESCLGYQTIVLIISLATPVDLKTHLYIFSSSQPVPSLLVDFLIFSFSYFHIFLIFLFLIFASSQLVPSLLVDFHIFLIFLFSHFRIFTFFPFSHFLIFSSSHFSRFLIFIFSHFLIGSLAFLREGLQ